MSTKWIGSTLIIISESISLILSLITLKIFRSNRTFQRNVFLFAKNMFFVDILSAIYQISLQTWHVVNLLYSFPEILPIRSCFVLISPQIFLIFTNQLLQGAIAIDRFSCVYFPMKYRQTGRRFYRLIVAVCISIGLVTFGLAYLDIFGEDTILLYCTLSVALGEILQYGFWFLLLVLGLLIIVVYLLAMVMAHRQVNEIITF